MPLHHYACPACDELVEEYRSVHEGGRARLPICPSCAEPMPLVIEAPAMDVGGVKGAAFKAFEVSRQVMGADGQLHHQTEHIDNLRKLRAVERDSEQRFRNGEGEPMRFRMWNQDRTNKDTHSFGDSGQIGGQAYANGQQPRKSTKIGTKRHGQHKPNIPLGPGMRRAASPLKG